MSSIDITEFSRLSENLHKRLVDTATAAKFLGCSAKKLVNDRYFAKGPAYYKLEGRVLYDIRDLKKYFSKRLQRIEPSEK